MKTEYYNKSEHVLFHNPLTRLLAKIFGNKHFIYKCGVCDKIPTELYGDFCEDHKNKQFYILLSYYNAQIKIIN